MIQLVVLSLLATAAVQAKIARVGANDHDDTRIINGADAPPGKYPSQVSIQVGNYHICGGTILNKNTVLTAAHCFGNMRNTDRLRVVTSTVNLKQPGRRYKIAKVIMHNGFRPNDILVNDVAVIKVANSFGMQPGVEEAVIISRNGQPVISNTWGTVIGWGYTEHNSGLNADILKEVEQQVLEYQPCSRIVGQIYSSQFCIIYPGYGKGICEGDSGGPVFQDGRQIGIISWRDGNGQCGRAPAVATLISLYVDWIRSNM